MSAGPVYAYRDRSLDHLSPADRAVRGLIDGMTATKFVIAARMVDAAYDIEIHRWRRKHGLPDELLYGGSTP